MIAHVRSSWTIIELMIIKSFLSLQKSPEKQKAVLSLLRSCSDGVVAVSQSKDDYRSAVKCDRTRRLDLSARDCASSRANINQDLSGEEERERETYVHVSSHDCEG